MSLSLRASRNSTRRLTASRLQPFSCNNRLSAANWEGRQPEEHITNRKDELNVQASASKSGKRARAEDSDQSSATSSKDQGNQNEQAKKDHPEAPGPVIGMNDERGGKGHSN
ncbi:hypothetical protein MMC12_007603 [Toensbergia leucococca]|nr:hypothetical protein [Toensbergia leucococca]